jgi:hypothetical protein
MSLNKSRLVLALKGGKGMRLMKRRQEGNERGNSEEWEKG